MSTWRAVLEDARAQYQAGIERRRGVAQAAHEAGLSYREIGEGLGTSASNAFKLVGKHSNPQMGSRLDQEARVAGSGQQQRDTEAE